MTLPTWPGSTNGSITAKSAGLCWELFRTRFLRSLSSGLKGVVIVMAKKSSGSSRPGKPHTKSAGSTRGLSAKTRAELERLDQLPDSDIDFSDIPELEHTPSGAEIGKFYRPIKEQITIRLDKNVLAWFKAKGAKYQTRINQALREYIKSHG